MEILQNLQPYEVFKYFEEISNIPRGSGNEKAISDYLVNFGKNLGLETIQDKALNVMDMKMHLQLLSKVIWIWCVKRIKIQNMILLRTL